MSETASVRLIALVLVCSFYLIAPGNGDTYWQQDPANNRPIIGILTQEMSTSLEQKYPGQYHSYIPSAYVKLVEGAGARVVPIWIGKDESYYEDIMSKINGVLWPGGAASFTRSNGYADAAATIYRIAKRYKTKGDYFPILAINLGFELMTYIEADRMDHRVRCHSENQPLPLQFTEDFRNSRLFRMAPPDVIELLRTKNVTGNYHSYCVTREGLASAGVDTKFRVTSINHDWSGMEFISSLERFNYPFYGLQFHPEKNLYEWKLGKNIPHGEDATKVSQYFANFFVNEARKSRHRFPSAESEAAALIYNYPVEYTALQNLIYTQCYMFDEPDDDVSFD